MNPIFSRYGSMVSSILPTSSERAAAIVSIPTAFLPHR
ncbi:hypothetical protein OTSANNIE_0362 [Anaplasma phagocytophilum str. Annie]|nr:hypothetical protein OTSANNIE_0362 [Anaplasma phagocytophilum str. Annie]